MSVPLHAQQERKRRGKDRVIIKTFKYYDKHQRQSEPFTLK